MFTIVTRLTHMFILAVISLPAYLYKTPGIFCTSIYKKSLSDLVTYFLWEGLLNAVYAGGCYDNKERSRDVIVLV